MNISMLRIVHLCLRFSIPMSELLRHQFYNFSVISFNRVSTVIGRSDKEAAHKFWLVWLCPSLIKLMQWKLMIQTNTGTLDKTFVISVNCYGKVNSKILTSFCIFLLVLRPIWSLVFIYLINCKLYNLHLFWAWGAYIAYWRLQYLLLIVEWEFVVHK